MKLGVEHSLDLVVDKELVPGEMRKIQAAVLSVQYIVLHNEDKRLDLELMKLHNCGRYDTVGS